MFVFRLALELGRVDVEGVLREVTWREIRYWMAFDRIQPFGSERDDLRSGLGFSSVCAALGHKVPVESYMPFTELDREELDQNREIEKAKQIALKMGAVP